jgi:hypothetical protein
MVNMADITVTFDDGSSHVYRNAPENLTKDDALARIAKDFAGKQVTTLDRVAGGKKLSTEEVITGAVTSLPSSLGSMAGDIYQAVTNPVQTAKAVLDLGAGALQNVLPEKLVQMIGEDKPSRELAAKVGQHYVERYGSVEGAKRALATDPAGVMADLSTVLTGGAMLPTRAAPALATAARAVDPLMLAARTAGKTADVTGKALKPLLGMQTGVGSDAIGQAYQAGKVGGETADIFKANLRGEVPQTEVLDAAKQNLAEMAVQRQNAYRTEMANISKDKTVLSFDGIDKAIDNAMNKTTYKGKVVNEKAFDKLSSAKAEIDAWKSLDPVEFHTPEGLDKLKQKVGAILEDIPYEQKTALTAVNEVYNGIKNEIKKQAPTYAKTMQAYSEATDLIREIEKSLSLGNKASIDTQMRKLQSIMRNNVNTNWGQRMNLAQQLEAAGGKQMMPALAGQALSNYAPRGLQGASSIPTALLAGSVFGTPLAAASLATSSPRLMGEAAYGAGRVAKGLLDVQNKMPNIDYPTMFNLLYQAEQPRKIDLTGMANP